MNHDISRGSMKQGHYVLLRMYPQLNRAKLTVGCLAGLWTRLLALLKSSVVSLVVDLSRALEFSIPINARPHFPLCSLSLKGKDAFLGRRGRTADGRVAVNVARGNLITDSKIAVEVWIFHSTLGCRKRNVFT